MRVDRPVGISPVASWEVSQAYRIGNILVTGRRPHAAKTGFSLKLGRQPSDNLTKSVLIYPKSLDC